ncbi:MAG TPA: hypothetical protein VGN57_19095 [Pirellulaceae bacterium]|nr:hypothetical protein [Pirellulaceae bacterium]
MNKELFGEPCPDFDEECVQCLHWQAVSLIERQQKALEDISGSKHLETCFELDLCNCHVGTARSALSA